MKKISLNLVIHSHPSFNLARRLPLILLQIKIETTNISLYDRTRLRSYQIATPTELAYQFILMELYQCLTHWRAACTKNFRQRSFKKECSGRQYTSFDTGKNKGVKLFI